MSTVFLAPVKSISSLDSYTGLRLPDDELGPTQSSPLLLDETSPRQISAQQQPTTPTNTSKHLSPLLDQVLRAKGQYSSPNTTSPGATGGLKELGEDKKEERPLSSSFTELLESRDLERDNAWMDTQTQTFTNWLNNRLKGSGWHSSSTKVQNLSEDLRDGTLLIKLLENLTKKKIRGYTKNPKMPAHKLDNLDLAFQFMKKEEVKLIGIGSLNIFEGNVKLTLGMMWTLIQKYQLRMKGYRVSTKDMLLQWLQALLPTWNITNFTKDWIDGRLLMAIIDAVKSGIAPNVSTLDPTKHHSNCTLAIKIADVHLKVPKIITPENLSSGNIDDVSLMTYISYFVEPSRAKLLKWVRRAISQHANIRNFTSDWTDGKSFVALINLCFPGVLPKVPNESPLENIKAVFEVCAKKLGIKVHFSVDDLEKGRVEELQIMTLILQIQNSELKSLPEAIVVSGPGLKQAEVGKTTSFVINTTEAGPGKLYIDSYYEDGKKMKFKLNERVSGVLMLSYTPTLPGKIIFDILWSDAPVPGGPFTVHASDSHLIQILDFENHERIREVGKVIELKLNIRQSGMGKLSAHLKYNGNKEEEKTQEANVQVLPNSVALLEYVPPQAGKPTLHIFLNNRELTHLALAYTVIEVGGYTMDTFPESRVYQTFDEANFSITSLKGLPLEILQMTAVLTSDIQIPIKFKYIDGDRGFASFKPTLSGVYSVEVVCMDKLIQGSPFTVEVTDPLSCKLRGNLPSFLEISKPYIFELDTTEAGVGDVSFECVNENMSTFFDIAFGHEETEFFKKLEICPTVEGEYLVGLKYHGQWIASSPFRVHVCDPTRFKVSGDLIEKKIGLIGKPLRMTITSSKDIDENLKPVVKITGPSSNYPMNVMLNEDKHSMNASFTPHEIGTHEISITYGGFHIPLSPFLAAVVALDSNTCTATGLGLQEAFTNIPAQFVVMTKTPGLIEDGTLQVKITGVVKQIECRVRIRDNKNGLYNVAYIATSPGAYLVNILLNNSHIAGSPFKLNAQPGPEPGNCIIYGPALKEDAVLSIGSPIDFSVDTSKGGTGKLTVKAVGPGGVQARVFMAKKSSKRGIHDIKLDPVRHGKYRVNVKWSNQHVPKSPFILKVFPGVDPTKCRAYGSGLEDGEVGTPTSFTIETRDAGSGTLKVCLHRVKDAFKINIKPKDHKDPRTLIARYYPKKPGDYLISILWSEKHIPGSPFRVKIRGEPIEDDFNPNKYKPSQRIEELQVIEEEGSSLEGEGVDFGTLSLTSEVNEAKPLVKILTSSSSLDESKMPMFGAAASMRGYHETFMHSKSKKKKNMKKRSSKSLSQLEQEKMMTFSSLQQLNSGSGKRHKRSATSPVKSLKGHSREFHGQATVHMKT